jgi:hypothetical protein
MTKDKAEQIIETSKRTKRQLQRLNRFLWDSAKYYSGQGKTVEKQFYMVQSASVERDIAECNETIKRYETKYPSLKVKRGK